MNFAESKHLLNGTE